MAINECKRCDKKVWKKESKWCILHDPDKKKNANLFWIEIKKMIEKKNYNFNGFNFIPRKGEETIFLTNVTFDKTVDFREAIFLSQTSFDNIAFLKNVEFNNAKFHGQCDFGNVTFSGDVNFTDVNFRGSHRFRDVNFQKNVWFSRTKFFDYAWFDVTTFSGKNASFRNAEFLEGVQFYYTDFFGNASFSETRFSENSEALFTNVRFIDSSYWYKTEFSKVDFRKTFFERPEQAKFYHTDLSKALFSPTSGLERIDFLNPKWAGEKRKEIFPGDDHLGTTDIDERYSELETMYRQLKRNYENKRNYPDAGDFYIGEMEMRRKNRKTSWLERKMILPFYKIVSNYGESYGRMFLLILGLIMFSSLLLLILGKNNIINVSLNVIRAITLQPLQGVNESENNTILAIFTFIRILGILFIALFTLALRRRFRR